MFRDCLSSDSQKCAAVTLAVLTVRHSHLLHTSLDKILLLAGYATVPYVIVRAAITSHTCSFSEHWHTLALRVRLRSWGLGVHRRCSSLFPFAQSMRLVDEPTARSPRTSHLAPRTSHLAPRTSHLAPRIALLGLR